MRPSLAHPARIVPLLAVISAAACGDAGTDPLATLVSPETVAALAVPVTLPGLVALAEQAGVEGDIAGELLQWDLAWDPARSADPLATVAERDAAIARATPVIADALGPGGVSLALEPLFRVERDLGLLGDVPADLVPAVEEIRLLVADARAALDGGRPDRALDRGLLAADRLRALGPAAVARTLIARADRAAMAALGVSGDAPVHTDALARTRGERMLEGARRALDDGNAELAVQRAFYAVQLLEQALASQGDGRR